MKKGLKDGDIKKFKDVILFPVTFKIQADKVVVQSSEKGVNEDEITLGVLSMFHRLVMDTDSKLYTLGACESYGVVRLHNREDMQKGMEKALQTYLRIDYLSRVVLTDKRKVTERLKAGLIQHGCYVEMTIPLLGGESFTFFLTDKHTMSKFIDLFFDGNVLNIVTGAIKKGNIYLRQEKSANDYIRITSTLENLKKVQSLYVK